MIRFEGVTKRFTDTKTVALNRVSFHVPVNGMLFVTGESGSGKTTLLRLLMKEFTADEGRIFVNGQDIGAMRRSSVPGYRKKIGYVFQGRRLLPDRSVYENVALAGWVAGAGENDIRSRTSAALRLTGIADCFQRRPDQLSGGEQAKVSIARAIAGNPCILLADEPTGNLDPESSLQIMRLLERIHERGTSVVIVTHDRRAIEGMKYPCITMREGEVRP